MTFVTDSFRLQRTLFISMVILLALVTCSSTLILYAGFPTTDRSSMSSLYAKSSVSFSILLDSPSNRQILPRATITTPSITYVILFASISGIAIILLVTITILYIRLRRHMKLFRRHMMAPDAPPYVVNPSWVGNTSPRNAEFPIEMIDVSSSTRLNDSAERPLGLRQDS
ncbi:hypothetical protein BDQ17DRAFT_1346251 [Cyathus striatus]|nr:hypothetical protein BDQ17DRAFT_1346251 [Cyathus striatus]